MTSSNFLLCYASVTTSLFDQVEHDMLALASAFIDDDEFAVGMPCEPMTASYLRPLDMPMT